MRAFPRPFAARETAKLSEPEKRNSHFKIEFPKV